MRNPTQHLLFGLLHVGAANSILDRLGVSRDKVREANARLFEAAMIAGGNGRPRRVVGDGEADEAVTGARRLAARRGQSQFRSEHLLFCLALDPGSSARRVLNDLGVDTARFKKELQEWVAPVQRRQRRIGKFKRKRPGLLFLRSQNLGPLVAAPASGSAEAALKPPSRSSARSHAVYAAADQP
ncbi:hypothetical protein DQ384_34115 [Sphaerisporangium album]|uniref:Clp R domain-containing protein n=1 Tax=Sphaerisporangium album TaxID=509200 RepID=A0A367EZC9_9ACTN|nr:Clp protease N-terminal domain-containing protein [Sphaerisporangium album]RCG23484.1 hypothetical protein DQ384_34115 [Sphaerisporangium album]